MCTMRFVFVLVFVVLACGLASAEPVDLTALEPGQSGVPPKADYRILAVLKTRGLIVVKADDRVYMLVSLPANNLEKGKKWEPDPKKVFTVVKTLSQEQRKALLAYVSGEAAKDLGSAKTTVYFLGQGRWGRAAYDDFPEPRRSKLAKNWQDELNRYIAQLNKILPPSTRQKTLARIAELERNDPPYIPPTPSPASFQGRWKMIGKDGKVSMYLTVTKDSALRDHAKDSPPLKMELMDDELRIHWQDGFKDVFKTEGGQMVYLGLGQNAPAWDGPPTHRLIAIRIGAKASPPAKALPTLPVTEMKAGESYATDGNGNTWGKVLQVIDNNNMLVGIDNGQGKPGGNPRYSVTVWCKFSTKGLTDGKTDFLGNLLGTGRVTVTGTTRYKTISGASKTVFVLEPAK